MTIQELETELTHVQDQYDTGQLSLTKYTEIILTLNLPYYFYTYRKEIQRKEYLDDIISTLINTYY